MEISSFMWSSSKIWRLRPFQDQDRCPISITWMLLVITPLSSSIWTPPSLRPPATLLNSPFSLRFLRQRQSTKAFVMSETLSTKPHLFEDELSEAENNERKNFSEWASSVPFKKQAQDFEIHESDDLKRRVTNFLDKLNLPVKVNSTRSIQNRTSLIKYRAIHWYKSRVHRHASVTAQVMRSSFQFKY